MAKNYLSIGLITIIVIISFTIGIVVGFSVNLGKRFICPPRQV